MDASTILMALQRKYANCQSNICSGNSSSEQNRIEFRSFYEKPDSFRFEIRSIENNELDILLSNSIGVFTYRSGVGLESVKGLESAIATGSAISFGAVNAIAELIFPNVMNPTTFGGQQQLMNDEMLDGVLCYHVKSENYISSLDIWISKEDLQLCRILRIISPPEEDSVHLRCEITFTESLFDVPIDHQLFLCDSISGDNN